MTTAEKIMEKVTGFNAWAKNWGDWHRGLKGRPDCNTCKGEGFTWQANGDADYDKEPCVCLK